MFGQIAVWFFVFVGFLQCQHVTIVYKNANQYSAFPTIIKPDTSTYLVQLNARTSRDHRDNRGNGISLISNDCGKTWEIQHIAPEYFVDSLFITRSGGYISPFIGGWEKGKGNDTHSWKSKSFKIVSRDAHNNFHVFKIDTFDLVMYYGRPGVCKLGDTILLSFYAKSRLEDVRHPYIARTSNAGSSWEIISIGMPTDTHGWSESALVNLNNSSIVALMRPDPDSVNFLFRSFSADAGITWSLPIRTPLDGFPASVIHLSGKKLFAVYGRRHKPYGIFATISNDGGSTWEGKEIVVRVPEIETGDLGYPQAVKTGDSEVLVVYYITGKDRVTYVESKIIKLPDE